MKDPNANQVKNILKNAIQNNDKILYSTLILLEIIDVIRKKYPINCLYRGPHPQIQSQIETEIETKIIKILDIFTKWETTGKAIYMDPPMSVDDYLDKTLNNLKCCYGNVIADTTKAKYEYKGPGNMDVQHAINAKECSANELISRDQGFLKFITMNDFQNLTITVI